MVDGVLSPCVLAVRDTSVSELQRSPAEEVQPPAFLRPGGEYRLSGVAAVHPSQVD